jgi:hypothetical protein
MQFALRPKRKAKTDEFTGPGSQRKSGARLGMGRFNGKHFSSLGLHAGETKVESSMRVMTGERADCRPFPENLWCPGIRIKSERALALKQTAAS